jgi:hypothetical protein
MLKNSPRLCDGEMYLVKNAWVTRIS